MVIIRDLEDERVSVFRSLKGKGLDRRGMFIAEGDKVVRELLNSNLDVVSMLMTKDWLARLRREFKGLNTTGMRIYIAQKKALESIVGFHLHQGLMAAAKIPPRLSLGLAAKSWCRPHLLLATERIKDAENMGLIVRNCLAFGVDCLIADKSSCNPYLRRAVRVSMGTIFKVPVVRADCLYTALRQLKARFKTRVIAAVPDKSSQALEQADFSGNICIVLGSEDYGLSGRVISLADAVVRIPISGELDSLNVACASAIFLQRAKAKRGSDENN